MKEEQIWILISKKISGEATAEELATLQQIIHENTEWQLTIERLQEVWDSKPVETELYSNHNQDNYLAHINRLKTKVSDFYEVGELEEISFKENKTYFTIKKIWHYLAAASVLAFITITYFLITKNTGSNSLKQNIASTNNEVKVSNGSRSKIILPDGSQVWINAGSKLTYKPDFKKEIREVILDGEAYFDVTKDKEHPFIVHTNGIDIKVLGTAFNVKAYNVEPVIEATLIHGSIEVTNTQQPNAPKLLMKPHEKLVFKKNNLVVNENKKSGTEQTNTTIDNASLSISSLNKNIADSSIVETAWVYNKLVFEDEKFGDVALKMERWYNVKISINDDKLKNQMINGSFVDESIDEALKILQMIVPFKYQKNKENITISKK